MPFLYPRIASHRRQLPGLISSRSRSHRHARLHPSGPPSTPSQSPNTFTIPLGSYRRDGGAQATAGATGKGKRRRKRRGRPRGKIKPLKTFRRTWNVFSEKQTKGFRGILCAWARTPDAMKFVDAEGRGMYHAFGGQEVL